MSDFWRADGPGTVIWAGSPLLENDRLKVGGQQSGELLLGLFLQLEAIYQEQDSPGVAGTEKELDDGSGGRVFPVPVAISNRKRSLPSPTAA